MRTIITLLAFVVSNALHTLFSLHKASFSETFDAYLFCFVSLNSCSYLIKRRNIFLPFSNRITKTIKYHLSIYHYYHFSLSNKNTNISWKREDKTHTTRLVTTKIKLRKPASSINLGSVTVLSPPHQYVHA